MKKKKLTKKYRFSILEDNTHKVRFQFRANRLTVILGGIVSSLLLLSILLVIIAYTPIKRLIPGYPSPETRREALQNAAKIEKLEQQMVIWSLQMENVQRIINGETPLNIDSLLRDSSIFHQKQFMELSATEDSLLKEEFMRQEEFDISTIKSSKIEQIEGILFFPPIKGVITENYNPAIGHPFVDIAAPNNSTVCSVLDGTIISAVWNDESGYTIQIQHLNDLVSVYKHNDRLLKKSGDKVEAGTPIAVVGDTGNLSTGPHLHFELWHKGEPIDPTIYIKF